MRVRLLHTADIHLDAPFRWLGDKGREQRNQLKETFRALVDLAMVENVDVLLVAGDLFDSNTPSADAIDLVQAQFARLPLPVILLPGTHDCLDASSIYRKVAFGGPASNVHVLDEDHTFFALSDLLTVHGRANRTNTSPLSPLRELKPNSASRFNVALAHGSLAMPGTASDFPMTPAEIVASRMDYVALGHWHSFRDCSAGTVTACYSGPPELLAARALGDALLVELTPAGTTVTRKAVGRRRYQDIALPLDQVATVEEIKQDLRRRGDHDLVLAVTLTGLRSLSLLVDPETLVEECRDCFFALKVKDCSHLPPSADELDALPEKTVSGQFARRMTTTIDQANSEEEKRIGEAALQLGIALLRGRKIL